MTLSQSDYKIIVPSRGRPHNMPKLRKLLPTAIVTVDERELDAYRPHVPDELLLPHPPMEGLWAVLNWAQEAITTPILFEVDDEFSGVHCLVGSRRTIRKPEEIMAIIENAMQAAVDLDASAFCFSRSPNWMILRSDMQPIRPVQAVCCAFGMRGPARHRKYSGEFLGRADVDWTLKTLLEDRFVYADCRFYFDCGRIFSGRGGNVGMVTADRFDQTSKRLKTKWGEYISYKAPFGKKHARSVAAMRINVDRVNPTAQR